MVSTIMARDAEARRARQAAIRAMDSAENEAILADVRELQRRILELLDQLR
jgi:hypothetical protein